MNIEWHIRLVDRLIKNNPEATIKDYFEVVDKEEKIDNVDNRFGVTVFIRSEKQLNSVQGYDFSSNGKANHV